MLIRDHQLTSLLAAERADRLRRDYGPARADAPRVPVRLRFGLGLIALGQRLAGPRTAPADAAPDPVALPTCVPAEWTLP